MSDSFGTPWAVAHQASLSMGVSRQECCSGLPFPSPEDLPDPDFELTSHACISCIADGFLTTEPPEKPHIYTLGVRVCSFGPVLRSETPWTVTRQAPLSMGFPRQEYRSRISFPSPGDLPDPGVQHGCPALQADYLPTEPPEKPFQLITY